MKTRGFVLFLSMLFVMFVASACSSAAPTVTPAATTILDGATLVQERCSVCHPVARIERTKYSAADWQTIVGMMISRGAKLTPEEKTVVVNYLSTNFGK
jgi:transcriptional regulator of nitric oxide reductase